MAHYQIAIHNETDDGAWVASLFEETDTGVVIGETISTGEGYTPREAVNNIDWHHDWTRYQISKEG